MQADLIPRLVRLPWKISSRGKLRHDHIDHNRLMRFVLGTAFRFREDKISVVTSTLYETSSYIFAKFHQGFRNLLSNFTIFPILPNHSDFHYFSEDSHLIFLILSRNFHFNFPIFFPGISTEGPDEEESTTDDYDEISECTPGYSPDSTNETETTTLVECMTRPTTPVMESVTHVTQVRLPLPA